MKNDIKLCPRFEHKKRACPECKKSVSGTGRVKYFEHTEIYAVEYYCKHCEEFFFIYSPENDAEIEKHQVELLDQ